MAKKVKYIIIGIIIGVLSVAMGAAILLQYIQYNKEVSRIDKFNNEYNEIFQDEEYGIKSTSITDANKKIRLASNKLQATLAALPSKEESLKFISTLRNISKASGLAIDVINTETSVHEFYNEHLISITLSGSKEHFDKFSKIENSITPLHSWKNCTIIDNNSYPATIYCDLATYYRKAEDFTKTTSKNISFPPDNTELWLPFLSSQIQSKLSETNKLKEDLVKYKNEIMIYRRHTQIKQQQKYAEAIVDVLSGARRSFDKAYQYAY